MTAYTSLGAGNLFLGRLHVAGVTLARQDQSSQLLNAGRGGKTHSQRTLKTGNELENRSRSTSLSHRAPCTVHGQMLLAAPSQIKLIASEKQGREVGVAGNRCALACSFKCSRSCAALGVRSHVAKCLHRRSCLPNYVEPADWLAVCGCLSLRPSATHNAKNFSSRDFRNQFRWTINNFLINCTFKMQLPAIKGGLRVRCNKK